MKYFATLLLLGATVYQSSCLKLPPHSSWAKEIATNKNNDEAENCYNKIFGCSDCFTTRVCRPKEDSGEIIIYKKTKCPNDRPYCDPGSGTCVVKEPPSCGKSPDDFVCLQKDHYFPDADCHRFHYCDSSYQAKLFECNPSTKVFSPITQQCEDPSNAQCGTFQCLNQAVQKTKHEYFETYYAMCNKDEANSGPLVVNLCPDFYLLNTTSQECEPDCKNYRTINIPDITDCHYYYHCKDIYIVQGVDYSVKEREQCPTGQAYDPTQYLCVDEGTVTSCKK